MTPPSSIFRIKCLSVADFTKNFLDNNFLLRTQQSGQPFCVVSVVGSSQLHRVLTHTFKYSQQLTLGFWGADNQCA